RATPSSGRVCPRNSCSIVSPDSGSARSRPGSSCDGIGAVAAIDEQHVLWSTPEPERAGKPLVVLLHGYGSHEGDLFALAPSLPLGAVVAAPRAFDPHPSGFGFSWFPLPGIGAIAAAAVDAAAAALHEWLAPVAADAASF